MEKEIERPKLPAVTAWADEQGIVCGGPLGVLTQVLPFTGSVPQSKPLQRSSGCSFVPAGVEA